MTVYLDCNATTPMEPAVLDLVLRHMSEEYGNAGSRTHEFGMRAKHAVERARVQVASVVDAGPDEVVFTSGATESNNLAILGLRSFGDRTGRRHIVTTAIEHKAVLEPIQHLAKGGFEVTLVPPSRGGWVEPDRIVAAVRPDTLLVSVMHVNNETGVTQPVAEIAAGLEQHEAYFHVDAAQGYGKDLGALRNRRLDLISISGHKIYGPEGIGALIVRRRRFERPQLEALFFGGGQERGLRPGTLPVGLIAGLGAAAEIAERQAESRAKTCAAFRAKFIAALAPLEPAFHGDQERMLPHVVNLSFEGLDSEAVMLALKGIVALSNGSACTSGSYEPSHVLASMGLDPACVRGALRWSWSHMTPDPDWEAVSKAISRLR